MGKDWAGKWEMGKIGARNEKQNCPDYKKEYVQFVGNDSPFYIYQRKNCGAGEKKKPKERRQKFRRWRKYTKPPSDKNED